MYEIMNKLNEGLDKYRPLPFWSWNDRLDPDELRKQVRWMHDMGMGGFFMHARNGLNTAYLSKEWMECIRACCEEAAKFSLEAWGYDENGYPSGFAGGKLLENPENRDMHLIAKQGTFDPEAAVSYRITEEELIRIGKGECTDDEEVLNLYVNRNTSTVDILNPEVTKLFLEETHEAYKTYFGDAFSKQMHGFFTDEPEYYRWHTPYTPMLISYFQEEYGEDLFDGLGLLFVKKKGYRTFRYRFWLAMQKLMLKNFAKQIYDWCHEHGVRLTGHYIEETSLGMQLWCCGGCMPFYEYEDIPGIDWLGQVTDNELSPRQLGSAARQLGKEQALTESFAATGWDTTPAELLRIVGFQYTGGVNLVCHHLLPYTERGFRKYDHPTHFAPVNPWIEDYFRSFNDIITRLSFLMTEGKEPVNVAVLHPMRSAYLEYEREEESVGYHIGELEAGLRECCRMLSARGIAYHFLDETLLEKHGFTEGAQIGCGQCAYDYLVLPKIQTMGRDTEKLLESYCKAGGKVLLMGDKPQYLEGDAYDYPYLTATCTLEEIEHAQPYMVENTETEIYGTYRQMDDTAFLFLQNASPRRTYTQTFTFPGKIKSFVAYDLLTLETKQLPLTVTLSANESFLLFPSETEYVEEKPKDRVRICLEHTPVTFSENEMPVDRVQYSTDGIEYSKPLYCGEVFSKLLKERYEGMLYLRYQFDVDMIPERIVLSTEDEGQASKLNGETIVFSERNVDGMRRADVTSLIKKGTNLYETAYEWYQSERLYRILEEDVNSGLRNAMTYDTEISTIYLSGDFGVYSRSGYEDVNVLHVSGRDFYIGRKPVAVTEPVKEGMPFFRGDFTAHMSLELSGPNVILEVPGRYQAARVLVNGEVAGVLLNRKTLDISKYAKEGVNDVEIVYTIGNRNLLGPLHYAGGENGIAPVCFEIYNFEADETGKCAYRLCRFLELSE